MRPVFVQRRTLHWQSWQAQEENRRTATMEMIEQLRETGMNWRSIATSYMPWNLRANTTQTLDRVRGQVENNFTDITILPQIGRRMELIMMVHWLTLKLTTMLLCQSHRFSLQITNCRNCKIGLTLSLMMATMELIIFWTPWQSWKVALTRNEKQCFNFESKILSALLWW